MSKRTTSTKDDCKSISRKRRETNERWISCVTLLFPLFLSLLLSLFVHLQSLPLIHSCLFSPLLLPDLSSLPGFPLIPKKESHSMKEKGDIKRQDIIGNHRDREKTHKEPVREVSRFLNDCKRYRQGQNWERRGKPRKTNRVSMTLVWVSEKDEFPLLLFPHAWDSLFVFPSLYDSLCSSSTCGLLTRLLIVFPYSIKMKREGNERGNLKSSRDS